jgi:hypothetical protein
MTLGWFEMHGTCRADLIADVLQAHVHRKTPIEAIRHGLQRVLERICGVEITSPPQNIEVVDGLARKTNSADARVGTAA